MGIGYRDSLRIISYSIYKKKGHWMRISSLKSYFLHSPWPLDGNLNDWQAHTTSSYHLISLIFKFVKIIHKRNQIEEKGVNYNTYKESIEEKGVNSFFIFLVVSNLCFFHLTTVMWLGLSCSPLGNIQPALGSYVPWRQPVWHFWINPWLGPWSHGSACLKLVLPRPPDL